MIRDVEDCAIILSRFLNMALEKYEGVYWDCPMSYFRLSCVCEGPTLNCYIKVVHFSCSKPIAMQQLRDSQSASRGRFRHPYTNPTSILQLHPHAGQSFSAVPEPTNPLLSMHSAPALKTARLSARYPHTPSFYLIAIISQRQHEPPRC